MSRGYDIGVRYKGMPIIVEGERGAITGPSALERILLDHARRQNENLGVAITRVDRRQVWIVRGDEIDKPPSNHAGVLLDMLVERLATSEDWTAILRDVQAMLDSYVEYRKPKETPPIYASAVERI